MFAAISPLVFGSVAPHARVHIGAPKVDGTPVVDSSRPCTSGSCGVWPRPDILCPTQLQPAPAPIGLAVCLQFFSASLTVLHTDVEPLPGAAASTSLRNFWPYCGRQFN
jgi:hypothetical protein